MNVAFAAVTGLTLLAIGGGIALAFTSRNVWAIRIGPLSEWIPGTLTAVALAWTLLESRRQRLKLARAEERSEARCVAVWIALRSVVDGTDAQDVHVCNTSDLPMYHVTAELTMVDGTTREHAFGVVPPHIDDRCDELMEFAKGDSAQVAQAAGCRFSVAGEQWWHRDTGGQLRKIEAPDPSTYLSPSITP